MPDYRAYHRGQTYICHSAKGSTWKNHKYIKKINGIYYYAKDKLKEATGVKAGEDVERLKAEKAKTQAEENKAKKNWETAAKRESRSLTMGGEKGKAERIIAKNVREYREGQYATAVNNNRNTGKALTSAQSKYNRSPAKAASTISKGASSVASSAKNTVSSTANKGKKAVNSAVNKIANTTVYSKNTYYKNPANNLMKKSTTYSKDVKVKDLVSKGQKAISNLFKKKKKK